jgi:uncharacterized Zn finger protein
MGYYWGEYVPVSERRAKAKKEMAKLEKKGKTIEPVEIEGRLIAKKFWGKKWCAHLETFADYENRLPRGRTYARNGSVCHLSIKEGRFEAFVNGSDLYTVTIKVKFLPNNRWDAIKQRCEGQIGSMLELLQGKISNQVMEIVADHKEGLFPHKKEMDFSCSCPDSAGICKHIAAVLYGVGNRLDHQPELLFLLRGVDPSELICTEFSVEATTSTDQLETDNLADIFGIDLDELPQKAVEITSLKANVLDAPKKAKKKLKEKWNIETLTGKELKSFREKKKLTVIEFSDKLGVTQATIYRWEKNEDILKLQARPKEALAALLS